jgi:hypothetical protein
MATVNYKPPGSVRNFLCSEKFISLIVGPVGSGKTTGAIFKILYHAQQMRKQEDGIRRSRCVVIRNTKEQLRDTTIPSIQTWWPEDICHFAKTDMKMMLKVGDVECEILLRGLDDADDVKKLLSLELSFAFMDEFREINQKIFEGVQGRVGRYPSKAMGGCVKDDGSPNHHVWGSTNAPDYGTYWEEYLTNPPENCAVHFQPSGLSPEADWTEHLIDGYYENLAQGKSEDWVDVFIHGKFGKSLSGQPVFRSFNRDIHVSKTRLTHNPSAVSPLIVGYDCGLTPAAVIAQVDHTGRLLTFSALTTDGQTMGSLRFIREKLKPHLNSRFPGANVIVIADPAGNTRAQTDEKTVFEILRAERFTVKAAKSNLLTPRLTAVDAYLTRMIDGKPGVLFDPECEWLIKALQGKYKFRTKRDGETEETPEKSHPWSDIADAFQYVCLHADQGMTFGGNMNHKRRTVEKQRYVWS